MIGAKNVLEIGSYHYRTTNQIAKAIDDTHGINTKEMLLHLILLTEDMTQVNYEIASSRINANFWYPYKTADTKKLDISKFVFDNSNFDNEELVSLNKSLLKNVSEELKIETFDLIFIDGDHTTTGIENDFNVISEFSDDDTLVVIDNIWDIRLIEVKEFFDKQNYIKWNFKEFNDKHFSKIEFRTLEF